jgi:ABC-2 type transport system permease protein
MLALPVSRTTIVLAKFIVLSLWCLVLSLVLFLIGILAGLAVSLNGWSGDSFREFTKVFTCSSLLTIVLCTPVAFVASAGRGYLLSIGFTILTLIITQLIFLGLPSITPWFPWAVPALYSRVAGPDLWPPGMTGYLSLFITSFFALSGTILWWNRADQK